MPWFALASAVLLMLALGMVVLVWRLSRKRVLRSSDAARIANVFALAQKIDDPGRRVLEGDKVLTTALGLLGYGGTTGEKLKKAGKRFSDEQAVWRAHKLRNVVAHEHGEPKAGDVDHAMRSFERALKDLGM